MIERLVLCSISIFHGCSRGSPAEGFKTPTTPNSKQIARSYIHSKNPKIRLDIEDMKRISASRDNINAFSQDLRDLPDVVVSKYFESHFREMSTRHNLASALSPVDCGILYSNIYSSIKPGVVEATLYEVTAEGLTGLLYLRVSGIIPSLFSKNLIVYESKSILTTSSTDVQQFVAEKGKELVGILSDSFSPTWNILKRRLLYGYHFANMRGISMHIMQGLAKGSKAVGSNVKECFLIRVIEDGSSKMLPGRKVTFLG
jgi:hypothetical protein